MQQLASKNITIIGGGIIGSSIAYHLSKSQGNIILLEQNQLTSGTTWHAAGIMGQIRNSATESLMVCYSRNLYKEFEEKESIGWKNCGALNITRNKEEHENYSQLSDKLKNLGIILEESPGAGNEYINEEGIYSTWVCPNDSVVNAGDVSMRLANEAKKNGVDICENTELLSYKLLKTGILVNTNNGYFYTDKLILATGMWFKNENLNPYHHFYAITEPCDISKNMPIIREINKGIYVREWSGGLLFGGFEENAKLCFEKGIPDDIPFLFI